MTEPYRMFTSRSEYRLSLRIDNADERLTGKGMALGCVGAERSERFRQSKATLKAARARLDELSLTPSEAMRHGLSLNQDGVRRSAFQLLSHPDLTIRRLAGIWPELGAWPQSLAERLETDASYAVYLHRQESDIAAFRRDEGITLPEELDYENLSGLSRELRSKLGLIRPRTLGQAARIEGITPAAITLLAAHARHRRPLEDATAQQGP